MKSDKCLREESHSPVSNVDSQDVGAIADDAGRFCNHKENRKAKQLCRQVLETLDLVLSGDCRDELLQSLHVVSVVPAPIHRGCWSPSSPTCRRNSLITSKSWNVWMTRWDGFEPRSRPRSTENVSPLWCSTFSGVRRRYGNSLATSSKLN